MNSGTKLDIIDSLKKKLDRYIQKKADFTAEITSEPLTTTKNLMLYKQVIIPLFSNTLLIDNIAKNEDLKYKDKYNPKLIVRFFRDGKELKAKFWCHIQESVSPVHYDCKTKKHRFCYPEKGFPYSGHCDGSVELQVEEVCNDSNDVEISLPGPLGEFAFYGFIENFIRNSAKHNYHNFKNNFSLMINFRISEPKNEEDRSNYYVLEVWDNVTNPEIKVDDKQTLKDFIDMWVKSEIIDGEGRLKRDAWGIAEMKISVALLKGSADFSTIGDTLRVESVCMGKLPGNCKALKKALVYKFYVMKPKFAGVLTESLKGSDKYKNKGIWIFKNAEELEQYTNSSQSFSSFDFFIMDKEMLKKQDVINKLKGSKQDPPILPSLPFRMIICGSNCDLKSVENIWKSKRSYCCDKDIINNLKGEDFVISKFKQLVWNSWLNRWEGNKNLHIYLQQECNELQTGAWKRFADKFNKNERFPRINVWAKADVSVKNFANKEEASKKSRTDIVWDRHGDVLSAMNSTLLYFYLPLAKSSSDFVHLFVTEIKNTLPFELVESGLLKIAVIDERLAELSGVKIKHNGTEASRRDLCKSANIYLFTHILVGSKESQTKSIHSSVKKECGTLLYYAKNKKVKLKWDGKCIEDFDIVIIHQGLIDIFIRQKNLDQEEFLESLAEAVPFVVVDSGRGIPSTISSSVKFLPFSILEDYLLGNGISKYVLTKIVMQLSRRKNDR